MNFLRVLLAGSAMFAGTVCFEESSPEARVIHHALFS